MWDRTYAEKVKIFADQLRQVFDTLPRVISVEKEVQLMNEFSRQLHENKTNITPVKVHRVRRNKNKIKSEKVHHSIDGKMHKESSPKQSDSSPLRQNASLRFLLFPGKLKLAQIILFRYQAWMRYL